VNAPTPPSSESVPVPSSDLQFTPGGNERERLSPFERIDFARLWKGRDRTTLIEGEVVERELARCDGRRLLEIGCGEGRLSPVVARRATEYVATDVVPRFLARLPAGVSQRPGARRIASNVYHLPFCDGAFTTVVMVRVFNFLSSPSLALREVARILVPGGSLVVSYHPRPSIETLTDDLRRGLHRRWGDTFVARTLAGDRTEGTPAADLARPPPSRAEVEEIFRTEWAPEVDQGVGLEDYRPFRWLPTPALRGLNQLLDRPNVLPMRLARFRRGGGRPVPLPTLDDVLACPRCRHPPSGGDWGFDREGRCDACGFVFATPDGVVDARYVPSPDQVRVPPSR
jgi:ubiquinone/menaquinone biosynthesis C-methylase UbiE